MLVRSLACSPKALFHPVLLGAEISGIYAFHWLLGKVGEVFRDERTKPWLGFAVGLIREGQGDGRIRKELDPEAAVAQIGILVLTNFALLPVGGWTDDSPAAWRTRRLAEMLRAIRAILFAWP